MKLSKMPLDELETLSYTDLAEMILKESKKGMNTPDIFKKICKLLKLSDEEYENKIGDFYTSLTTDKDFVLLDSGTWDLRDRHSSDVLLKESDEEEDLTETEEEIEEEMEEMAPDEYHEMDDDTPADDTDIDDVDDALENDLTIVDEDELDEE